MNFAVNNARISATGGYTPPNITVSAGSNGIGLQPMTHTSLTDLAKQNMICAIAPLTKAGNEISKKCMDENAKDYMLENTIRADHSLVNSMRGQPTQQYIIQSTVIEPWMIAPK